MYIELIDLSKAYPNDSYRPFSQMVKLVGFMPSHAIMSLMDSFVYYYQIPLHSDN